jgi:hypothetical protein
MSHHFSNTRPHFLRIVVGQHDLEDIDEEERVFDVEQMELHPEWE